MSIGYIKKNLEKFDRDNLISFLFDIITCGAGLDSVQDFDPAKVYTENEKVYYRDIKGFHHIYKCKVESSTPGEVVRDEWIDLLQSFRKPLVDPGDIISSIEVGEEVIISLFPAQTEFTLTTKGVEDGMYDIVVFHPTEGRLAKTDFELVGKNIILDSKYAVNQIGSKLIVDLYRTV